MKLMTNTRMGLTMKKLTAIISKMFVKREITREMVRESIRQDAEREIRLNWFYQAN